MLCNHDTMIDTVKLTLVQYYELSYRLHYDFTPFPINIPFSFQDPVHVAFSPLRLRPLQSVIVSHSFLVSHDLDHFE